MVNVVPWKKGEGGRKTGGKTGVVSEIGKGGKGAYLTACFLLLVSKGEEGRREAVHFFLLSSPNKGWGGKRQFSFIFSLLRFPVSVPFLRFLLARSGGGKKALRIFIRVRETGARACTNFPKKKCAHTAGYHLRSGGRKQRLQLGFPRKIGFYSREKIILSLLLRGKEGWVAFGWKPGVLFSVLKRRREAKMVIWQTNRRRRRNLPPLPAGEEKEG